MFMLSCTTRDLGFRSINNASIFDNTELKAFKNIKFLGKISNNWPKDLFGTNVHRTLDSIAID